MTPTMNWFVKTFKPWQMIVMGLISLAAAYFSSNLGDGFFPGFISGLLLVTGLSLLFTPLYLKFK